MANWNEAEYVAQAKGLAQQYVVSKRPINELAQKCAMDNALNPDEIRTLTRITNVEVFRSLFDSTPKTAADRNIEFVPGDAEVVIRTITQEAAEPPRPATVDNDKLAFEVPDLAALARAGIPYDQRNAVRDLTPFETVKEAAEAPRHAVRRKEAATLTLRKYRENLEVEKHASELRWEAHIDALVQEFRKAYGPDFVEFVKDAHVNHGSDAYLELESIRTEARLPAVISWAVTPDPDHHLTGDTPAHAKLAAAIEERRNYTKLSKAVEVLVAKGVV